MMHPLAGAAAGAGYGGLLGQVGDTFSVPRRMLWSSLGLPESGAELIGGENPSTLAQILGGMLEMTLDPLSIALGVTGYPLMRMYNAATQRGKQLQNTIDVLSSIPTNIGEPKNLKQLQKTASAIAKQLKKGGLDLEGIGQGKTIEHLPGTNPKQKWETDPYTLQEMKKIGWAIDAPELILRGEKIPRPLVIAQIGSAQGKVGKKGPVLPAGKTIPPVLHLSPEDINVLEVAMTGKGLPNPTVAPIYTDPAKYLPFEVAINRVIRRQPPPLPFSVAFPQEAAAAETVLPGIGSVTPREAARMIDSELMTSRAALPRYQINDSDLAQIMSALGVGSYAGGLLGFSGG